MIKRNLYGIVILCGFFVVAFALAFIANPHYPAKVISGELSVGTWMSGVLLTFCAATSLIFGMQQRKWQWYLITVFFLLLAADEYFMFHEQLKHRLIFADHTRSRWMYELPVLAGAVAGMFIAFVLWRLLQGRSRWLLVGAVILGTLSAGMDVMTVGVLLEDACKLFGELALACALLLSMEIPAHYS